PVELSARAFGVFKRLHFAFLGNRDVVDSTVGDRRRLATRGPTTAADLRSTILDPGVPAGDVYRRDLCLCQSDGSELSHRHSARLSVRGIGGMGNHFHWNDARVGQPVCAAMETR